MKLLKISIVCFAMAILGSCKNAKEENSKMNSTEDHKTTAAKTEPIEIEGAVGTLKGILQTPAMEEGQKYPIVILMHGIFSNKETPLVTHLADGLQKKGIASIRFDFNGHGESDGKFIDMTVPLEVEDAKAVFNYANQLDFVSGISLMGHSQGGVVASLLAGELGDQVTRLALFAPAAVMEDLIEEGKMMGKTFDPQNPPEYIEVNSEKVGKAYLESTSKLDIYERAEKFQGPVLIVQGKADQIVPYQYAETYDERYQNSELHLLEDVDHVFTNATEKAAGIGLEFLAKLK